MRRADLADILDGCLQRLRDGETTEDCLARHPEQAAELAPMLMAASQLQRLADYRLSNAQRLRAKVTLRETLADRSPRAIRPAWRRALGRAGGLAMVSIAAALVLVATMVTVVAASQPGQQAYRLRVVAERIPALIQISPANRAVAEVSVADRRLSDLRSCLEESGQANSTALNALVAGDQAAADSAVTLPETERWEIATRVSEHAHTLTELAETASNSEAAETLRAAANRALAIAEKLRAEPPGSKLQPGREPTLPVPGNTSEVPSGTSTPTHASMPTASPTPHPPRPKPSATSRPRLPAHTCPPRPSGSPTPRPTRPRPSATDWPWTPAHTRVPRPTTRPESRPTRPGPRATPRTSWTPTYTRMPRPTTRPESRPALPKPGITPTPDYTRLPRPTARPESHPARPGPVITPTSQSPGRPPRSSLRPRSRR